MKSPARILCAAGVASAALFISAAASADTSVIVRSVPVPVYEHGPTRYVFNDYGYDHERHRGCRAPEWDPNARYMPGQVVWREGKLWAATDVSAQVYNVNSPPEWTPRYWVRAHCR